MMKFKLQGNLTDLEIELKRSKEYYDWSLSSDTKIVFEDSPDACPVGTVEWVLEKVGHNIVPLSIINCDIDLGREFREFSGNQVPKDITTLHRKVLVKSKNIVKFQENGWYYPGELLMPEDYIWFEKFKSPIVGEFRVFLDRDGTILDIRNYIGYKKWPDIDYIEEAAKKLYEKYKRAISFDVVVLENNKTYLLEAHDYWALGLYGFSNLQKLPFLLWSWWKNESKNKRNR